MSIATGCSECLVGNTDNQMQKLSLLKKVFEC